MNNSCVLKIITINKINKNSWSIKAKVNDSSGTTYANDINIGDIIYSNTINDTGYVSRYKIIAINAGTSIKTLFCDIQWDDNISTSIQQPIYGSDNILGSTINKLGNIKIPSYITNKLSQDFVNEIENFENNVIGKKIAPINSPNFIGKPTTITPDEESNDKQIANTEWVNSNIEEHHSDKYIANNDITQYKVVGIIGDDLVDIMDCMNEDHFNKSVGICLENVKQHNIIKVKDDGVLENVNWDFSSDIGTEVFLGENGEICMYPIKDCKFIQRMGTVVGKHKIEITIEDGVLIV